MFVARIKNERDSRLYSLVLPFPRSQIVISVIVVGALLCAAVWRQVLEAPDAARFCRRVEFGDKTFIESNVFHVVIASNATCYLRLLADPWLRAWSTYVKTRALLRGFQSGFIHWFHRPH